ncbi:MAG: aldo/keto reductase [Propionibacteriaceae bacterium]
MSARPLPRGPHRLRSNAADRTGVFGPPPDRDHAVQLLRQAVEAGVDHIDTAEYYGPHVVNELIRQAQSSAHYAIGPRERVHFVSFGGRAVIELAAVWQQRSSNAAVSAFISSATPQAGTTTSSDT